MILDFFDLRRQPIGSTIWVWRETEPDRFACPASVKVSRADQEVVLLESEEARFEIRTGTEGIYDRLMLTSEGRRIRAETRRKFCGGVTLGDHCWQEFVENRMPIKEVLDFPSWPSY